MFCYYMFFSSFFFFEFLFVWNFFCWGCYILIFFWVLKMISFVFICGDILPLPKVFIRFCMVASLFAIFWSKRRHIKSQWFIRVNILFGTLSILSALACIMGNTIDIVRSSSLVLADRKLSDNMRGMDGCDGGDISKQLANDWAFGWKRFLFFYVFYVICY